MLSGDLWISWEEGMKVFDELLLDADWAVNAGMWMWLSSSSFFQQFFHCYCPVRFGRRADPNGDYIRKYLPILKVSTNNRFLKCCGTVSLCRYKLFCLVLILMNKLRTHDLHFSLDIFSVYFHYSKQNFPTRYIHEPWNAPPLIQKAAKCIIGRG